MSAGALVVVVVLALVLAYFNGLHDASNAVSTTISTRALRESSALAVAAVLNLLGALLGGAVLVLSASWAISLLGLGGLVHLGQTRPDTLSQALIGVLLATIAWLLITWWAGMPASTWHTVHGAVVGSCIALGVSVGWDRIALLVALPVLLGPLIAVPASYLLMNVLLALDRSERLRSGHLRFAQAVAGGTVAAGHGLSDCRIPLAITAAAVWASGLEPEAAAAAILPVALAIAAGTLMGGHRIIRTLGRGISDLTTAQGLSAETTAATIVGAGALGLGLPVSTSQTVGSSLVGAGLAMGVRHIRWRVVGQMVATWVLSPLAAALLSGVFTILQVRLL